MGHRPARAALTTLLMAAIAGVQAAVADEAGYADDATLASLTMTAEDAAIVGVGTASVPAGYVNKKDPWIDRAHQGVFNAVWRSAMRMDQLVRRRQR